MPPKGQRQYRNWLKEGFPLWLQERLRERELNASNLADMIGVDAGVISNYMSGKRIPAPEFLNRIADALAVSDQEIYTAAGYLRSTNYPEDDPRRMELINRLIEVELTPERYKYLSVLLDSMSAITQRKPVKGQTGD